MKTWEIVICPDCEELVYDCDSLSICPKTNFRHERRLIKVVRKRVAAREDTERPTDDDLTELVEMPRDLARLLKDPSVIIPQDAAVFDLIAKWRNAPTPTMSGPVRDTERPDGGDGWDLDKPQRTKGQALGESYPSIPNSCVRDTEQEPEQ